MNRYDRLAFLAGFLTLILAKTAIGETSTQNIIDRENTSDIIHSCDRSLNQVLVPTSSLQATTKVQHNSSRNSFQEPIPDLDRPRLWWAAEQFDPFDGRLVRNWLTYPKKKQINLVVNWQLWTLLDYLGRYRFVNQFGTVAREYGYSLSIFNQKEQCLAVYKYNSVSNPPKWELHLEKLGQDSLQVKPLEFEGIRKEELSKG